MTPAQSRIKWQVTIGTVWLQSYSTGHRTSLTWTCPQEAPEGCLVIWLKLESRSYIYWTVHHLTSWINWTNLMSLYESFYCSTCFECYYIHPQEPATLCRCIAQFQCVLVYWWGSAGVGWFPNAGWSSTPTYSRRLPRINVITFETCWAIKTFIKWQQVSSIYSTSKMTHGPLNIRNTKCCKHIRQDRLYQFCCPQGSNMDKFSRYLQILYQALPLSS